MVGTLRAASENDKQNGRCTQRPYIAEQEQIKRIVKFIWGNPNVSNLEADYFAS